MCVGGGCLCVYVCARVRVYCMRLCSCARVRVDDCMCECVCVLEMNDDNNHFGDIYQKKTAIDETT